MSGGHFDYKQYYIDCIADEVEQLILTNDQEDGNQFSEETIEEFKKGLELLRQAYVYAQRIDWLVSCDDSEENFHERLKQELSDLSKKEAL